MSLHSYTGSALKSELNFCNSYLSLLYFVSRAYFPCILACISGQLLLSKLQICVKLNISLLGIINYLMHTKYILEFAVRNCNSRRKDIWIIFFERCFFFLFRFCYIEKKYVQWVEFFKTTGYKKTQSSKDLERAWKALVESCQALDRYCQHLKLSTN